MAVKLKFKCKSVIKEEAGFHTITLVNHDFSEGVAAGIFIFSVLDYHKALKVFKPDEHYHINITKIKT